MSRNSRSKVAATLSAILLPSQTYEELVEGMFQAYLGMSSCGVSLSNEFRQIVSYKIILDWQADLLTDLFNEDELMEITRFYKSPVGKKTIQVLPRVGTETTMFVERLLKDHDDARLGRVATADA